jgi:hypothetical protein
MMEQLAQPSGRSTNMYQVVVYTPAERADTLPLFLLYPYMYSVAKPSKQKYLREKIIFYNPLCVRMF